VALVAVIADTHMPRGSRRLPEECLRRLRTADVVIHAGDLTGRSFLAGLLELGRPLHVVRGNADEPELAAALPAELVVAVEGVRIGVTHEPGPAPGREQRLIARFPGCDAVVYGHTHRQQVGQVGGVWVLNPGSPTERRRSPSRGMLELHVEDVAIRPYAVTFDA
jgi:putative phosphoesterase